MMLIEPCCAAKQVMQLRNAIGKNGTRQFEGYGDLSLTELLPALLTRYSETEMLIAAPTLPDQAAEIIRKWLRKQWARMDGKGKLNVIARLTIVADLSPEQSPLASQWLAENPFADRLVLIDYAQPDTALLLPDLAITGPLNLRYGHRFTATATAVQEQIDTLWKHFTTMGREETEAAEEMVAAEETVAAEEAEAEAEPTATEAEAEAVNVEESQPAETEADAQPAEPEAVQTDEQEVTDKTESVGAEESTAEPGSKKPEEDKKNRKRMSFRR